MTSVAPYLAYNPDDVRPGWIALLLVVALGVATYLLWRSMNRQLRRIDVPTQAEADRARRDAVSPDTSSDASADAASAGEESDPSDTPDTPDAESR